MSKAIVVWRMQWFLHRVAGMTACGRSLSPCCLASARARHLLSFCDAAQASADGPGRSTSPSRDHARGMHRPAPCLHPGASAPVGTPRRMPRLLIGRPGRTRSRSSDTVRLDRFERSKLCDAHVTTCARTCGMEARIAAPSCRSDGRWDAWESQPSSSWPPQRRCERRTGRWTRKSWNTKRHGWRTPSSAAQDRRPRVSSCCLPSITRKTCTSCTWTRKQATSKSVCWTRSFDRNCRTM